MKTGAEQSADTYGEIARTELQMASEATKTAHFGTAETHRKNAAMAFDCEMKLRLSRSEQSTTVTTPKDLEEKTNRKQRDRRRIPKC